MAWRQALSRWSLTGIAAASVTVGGIAWCEADPRSLYDPEALERGAKALREIQKSPHAKKVFELSKQQEVTKQQESKTQEAQYQAQAAQWNTEQERVRWQEQRKSMQEDAKMKAELAQYQDQLARKRSGDEHEKNRERNAELVRMQEQSTARQEQQRAQTEAQIQAERRASEKYKADLDKDIQRDRALAEAEGRALEARENEDVNRRSMLTRLDEERKRTIEAINTVFANIGGGATSLLSDPVRLTTAVAGTTLLFLGIYTAREGTRVAGKAIDSYLGTPNLVRETSRKWFWQRQNKGKGQRRDFGDIILQPALHDQVRTLTASSANTRLHQAPFRHMLFYGPPGTGKTLVAKRMARTSGLDYAIMSGGDVAPLGGNAVTQLHSMFDWAETSRKGLLLFIDEADAFLGRRSGNQSEGLRGALNALLFRTGDQSRDYAVVLATNRPADLDAAVLDRMDEALEFGLPGTQERFQLLKLYLEQYIIKAGTAEGGAGSGSVQGIGARLRAVLTGKRLAAAEITVQGIDDSLLQDAAERTEGFSGRELAKLLASVQAAVYGSRDTSLTRDLWQKVVSQKLREHSQRRTFLE
ncbi:hypothetical protein WJX74_005413 [Apatococcus lobatus]|uniref:AAA+ ATPase domain-containing protein n=1 Tax=Apatococcus lobatus TaxID=904363 RepID=A0AAW1SGD4_9CHLO